MEKTILDIAVEGVRHIQVRQAEEALRKVQKEPKPISPPVDLSGWVKDTVESLKEQMRSAARSVVDIAEKEVTASFNVEDFKTHVISTFTKVSLNNLWKTMLIEYLPLLRVEMERVMLARDISSHEARLRDAERKVGMQKSKIPKPFSPDSINIDPRFPASRCRELQGRYFDAWLTDGLKSKPVFFDSLEYVNKLIEFHDTVYVPLKEKEQEPKTDSSLEPSPNQGKAENEGTDSTLFVNRHSKFQA